MLPAHEDGEPSSSVAVDADDSRGSSASDSDCDEGESRVGRRSTWDQRVRVARAIGGQRRELVRALHTVKSRHVVDNLFSFVTGNMAVVCWVLGGMYHSRACSKPLAGFLVVLGGLALFAACLPILVRQWFYLHARFNWWSAGLLVGSALYVVWLLLGQSWAFDCSPSNCDQELCTAANTSAFVLYAALLLYAAKVAWYLSFRVRFPYRELLSSCMRDPYPDALRVDEDEFARLHDMVTTTDASEVRLSVSADND